MPWEQLIDLHELDDRPRVVRSGNKQLAVFKTADRVLSSTIAALTKATRWPKVLWMANAC
jgi:hypothetical protein